MSSQRRWRPRKSFVVDEADVVPRHVHAVGRLKARTPVVERDAQDVRASNLEVSTVTERRVSRW